MNKAAIRRKEKQAARIKELKRIYGVKDYDSVHELKLDMLCLLAAVHCNVITIIQLMEACAASDITLKSVSNTSMDLIYRTHRVKILTSSKDLKAMLANRV